MDSVLLEQKKQRKDDEKRPLKQLVDLPLVRFLSLESFLLTNLLFDLKAIFWGN